MQDKRTMISKERKGTCVLGMHVAAHVWPGVSRFIILVGFVFGACIEVCHTKALAFAMR